MDTGASVRCVRRREARPSTLSSQVEHAIPEGYVNRAFYSKRASARWGGPEGWVRFGFVRLSPVHERL